MAFGDPLVVSIGGSSAGTSAVGGDVAAGVADSGNPIKIGGKAVSAVPASVTTGQRVDASWTLKGALYVCVLSSDQASSDSAIPNFYTDPANNSRIGTAAVWLYDGSGHVRQRGNVDLAPASIGALPTNNTPVGTVTGTVITNYNGRGLVVVTIPSDQQTGALVTTKIYGIDQAGNSYLLIQSIALAVTNTLTVYPGCVAVANSVANLPLPKRFRIDFEVTVAGTIDITATACIIV